MLVERANARSYRGPLNRSVSSRLAAEELDLSTGQLSRGIPVGIGLSRCRIGRIMTSERFMMAKWLEIACFHTSVFPIIPVVPHFSRKKDRATFSPESEPYPFSLEPKAGLWKSERTQLFPLYPFD